jgi:hypothetical protein
MYEGGRPEGTELNARREQFCPIIRTAFDRYEPFSYVFGGHRAPLNRHPKCEKIWILPD